MRRRRFPRDADAVVRGRPRGEGDDDEEDDEDELDVNDLLKDADLLSSMMQELKGFSLNFNEDNVEKLFLKKFIDLGFHF